MECGVDGLKARPSASAGPTIPLFARLALLSVVGIAAAFLLFTLHPASAPEPVVVHPLPGLGWLNRELGPPKPGAPLEREPIPGVLVSLGPEADDGFRVERGRGWVRLRTADVGPTRGWTRHAYGIRRATAFGAELITVTPRKTELYLEIARRLGERTWTWGLDTNLEPRLSLSGAVVLAGQDALAIDPVRIYDERGADVTPSGARWQLRRDDGRWALALALDDSELPTPYFIDPGITTSPPAPYRDRVVVDDDAGASGDAEPLGYWRFSDATTVAANQILGGVAGTHNGVVLGAAGGINDSDTAVTFDGVNDHVQFLDNFDRTGTSAFTLEAWVKRDSTMSGTAIGRIFSKRSGTGGEQGYELFVSNSATTFRRMLNGTINGVTGTVLAGDTWNHVVATYDGTDMRLYINGVQSGATVASSLSLTDNAGNFVIGARSDGAANTWFKGSIDEPAIYPVGLSAAEVQAHYDRGRDFGLSITESTGDQHVAAAPAPTGTKSAGPILYYNPAVATGSTFTVTATNADPDDTPFDVVFPTDANWSSGGGNVSSPFQTTYTWASGAKTIDGTKDVQIRSGAAGALTTTGTLQVLQDSAAPTGGAVSFSNANAAGYRLVTSVGLTLTLASDALSGLDGTTRRLFRASATLSNNVCGVFGSFSQIDTLTSSQTAFTDATVASGSCYRYEERVKDNVGNEATFSTTAQTLQEIKVDASPPDFGSPALTLTPTVNTPLQFVSGTQIYLNTNTGNSGTFTVDAANVADPQSGLQKLNFPSVAGLTRTDPATPGDDPSSPYQATYTWSASTTAATPAVTATANSTDTSTATFTVTPDSAGPTGGAVTVTGLVGTGGVYHNASLTLGLSITLPTDAGSGIAQTLLQRRQGNLASSNGIADGACDFTGASYTTIVTNPSAGATTDTVPSDGNCYQYRLLSTDNVGNDNSASPPTSVEAKVDTTAAAFTSAVSLSDGGDSDAHVNGTTIYLNAQLVNGGSFTATATPADGQSGIERASFPSLSGVTISGGGDDTTSSDGYTATYTWTAASLGSANVDDASITATNNAAKTTTTTTNAIFDVIKDVAGPTGGSITVEELTGTGTLYDQNTSIKLTLGLPSDGTGSGIAVTKLQRAEVTLASSDGIANGACGDFSAAIFTDIATNPAAGTYTDTVPSAGKCYRYRLLSTDNVGNDNSAAPPTSNVDAKVDDSAPTFASAVALNDGGDDEAHVSGTTIYLNAQSGNGGTFTATSTPTDSQSGIVKATFPSLVPVGIDGGGDDPAGPYTTTYTWDAADLGSGNVDDAKVTAQNNAFITSSTATNTIFDVIRDTTKPTGGSISYFNGSSTDNTPTITFSTGGDSTGSGIASWVVQRAACGSTDFANASGSSPGGGTFTEPAALPAGCYVYRLQVTDNVGNTATFTSTAQYTVTAASLFSIVEGNAGGQHQSGDTLFVNATAGTFTVRIAESALPAGSTVDFPAKSDAVSGTAKTGATAVGGFFESNTYTSDGNASSSITVTLNSAGDGSSTETLTVTLDTAGPISGSISYADGYDADASVPITFDPGNDGSGSGITPAQIQRQLGTLSNNACSFADVFVSNVSTVTSPNTLATGDCARYRLRVTDNVGNESIFNPAGSPVVKIDLTAPTISLAVTEDPADDDQHAAGTAFHYRPAGNGGSFTVTATVSDPQSGVSSVAFPVVFGSDGSTGAATAKTYTWATSASATGSKTVTVTNGATPGATADATFTVSPDSGLPVTTDNTGTIGSDWKNTDQTVTLTPTDPSSSGVAATYFTTDDSTPTTSSSQGTSIVLNSNGTYTIKYFSVDNVGNPESVKTGASQIRIDKTPPTGTLTSPADGATVSGSIAVSSDSADALSGVSSVEFQRSPAGASSWTSIGSDTSAPFSASLNTTILANGSYDLRAVTADVAGNTFTSTTRTVVVANATSGAAPKVTSISPANGSTVASPGSITVNFDQVVNVTSVKEGPESGPLTDYGGGSGSSITKSISGGSGVRHIQITYNGTTEDFFYTDWSSISGTDSPPNVASGTPNRETTVTTPEGITVTAPRDLVAEAYKIVVDSDEKVSTGTFSAVGAPVKVEVRRLSDDSLITFLSRTLRIVLGKYPIGTAVAASSDGGKTWFDVPRSDKLQLVPPLTKVAHQDKDGVITILADTLTFFAAVADKQPPSKVGLQGLLEGDLLTLRWTSATDDGPIKHYQLFASGQHVQNLGEVQYEVKLGGVTRSDPREFDIRAQDLAGNTAPPSNRVKVVPDVTGKTEAEARAAVEAAGFKLGRVIEEASTAPSGTVIRQSAAVADVGAAINLVVATQLQGRAAFRMQVASAPRIVIGRQRTLNVRVAVTEPARVRALLSLRRPTTRVKGWSMRWNARTVEAGATILKLRLPKNLRRPGTYRLRVRATSVATGEMTTRTMRLRVLKKKPPRRMRRPLEVVVVTTGEAEQRPTLELDERFKVSEAASENVFDVTTEARTEVEVVVIDADAEGGLELIRALRLVYPDLRIVALAGREKAAAARRAGADPVLIKPVSDELLSMVVRQLTGG